MLFGYRARLAETTFLNAKFLFCVEIFFDRNYVSSAWIVWGEPMEVLTQVVKLVTSNSDGSTVRRRGPPHNGCSSFAQISCFVSSLLQVQGLGLRVRG